MDYSQQELYSGGWNDTEEYERSGRSQTYDEAIAADQGWGSGGGGTSIYENTSSSSSGTGNSNTGGSNGNSSTGGGRREETTTTTTTTTNNNSGSSSTSSSWSSSKSANINSSEFAYYEQNPATNIDYTKNDMYGVYLVSMIKHNNPDVKDGIFDSKQSTQISQLFGITTTQAEKMLKVFGDIPIKDDGTVLDTTQYFSQNIGDNESSNKTSLSNKIFINNITISSLKEKVDAGDITMVNAEFNDHNAWLISCKKYADAKKYDLDFYVIFLREYPFNSVSLAQKQYITLANNDFNVRFNIIKDQSGLKINYCDITRFLWFNIESYADIDEIGFSFINKAGEKIIVKIPGDTADNNFLRLKSDISLDDNYYTFHTYSDFYSDSSGSYKILDNFEEGSNVLEENVDYFLYQKNIDDDKKATYVKFYLSDRFLQAYQLGDIKDIKNIEIYLQFDEEITIPSNNDINDITNSTCFIVSTNNNCTIDRVLPYPLYYKYKKTSENYNNPIVIYKLKSGYTDFGGSISMYYGNQIIYPLSEDSDSIGSNTAVKPNGLGEYKTETLYYETKIKDDCLYVYLKITDIPNGKGSFVFNKFITVILSNDGSGTGTSVTSGSTASNITGKISQDTVTLHSVSINIPQVSKGDTLVYIDDSINNKTKHYTNYTQIETETGKVNYGVRAFAHINPETQEITYFNTKVGNIGIPELSYNVPATIVKLTPVNEAQTIYSFINGTQQLIVDKSKTNITIDGNQFKGDELLASYVFSYEYIVEKDNSSVTNDHIFNFRGIYATYSNLPTTYINHAERGNYQAYISYGITEKLPSDNHYLRISNISPNYPIYYNLDDDPNNNAYEYNFIETPIDSFGIEDKDNIYKKVTEYVKIQSGSISLDTFKKNVYRNAITEANGCDRYYRYSSISNTYSEYTADEVRNMTSVPLNIYVKYEYYLKTGEIQDEDSLVKLKKDLSTDYLNTKVDSTITENYAGSSLNSYLSNTERYKKDISWQPVSFSNIDLENSDRKYFTYINGTYYPFNGFVRDGSSNYYGYILSEYSTYNLIDDEKNNRILGSDTYIYLKQDFKEYGTIKTQKEFEELKVKGITLYYNDNETILDFIEIDKDASVYDLDVTGNTIYSSSEKLKDIIDLEKIKNQYNNINWTPKENEDQDILKDNIKQNPNNKYRLANWEIGTEKVKVKYIVSIKGNYQKLDNWDPENISNEGILTYIKDEGYNKICEHKNDNNTLISILKSYNSFYNNLYAYLRKKLTATELVENYKYLNSKDGYYYRIETTGDYRTVNTAGKISGVNYVYQQPVYKHSYDIHMSVNKDYFTYATEKTVVYDGFVSASDSRLKYDSLNKPISFNGHELLSITFYENKVSHFITTQNAFNNIKDINITIGNSSQGDNDPSCYIDDLIFETKYFYSTYCINDGIHIDKDGSYYTNAMVFDGKTGKIAKKLILNSHTTNITKYTYEISSEVYIPLDKDTDLSNISKFEYSNYYISYDNGQEGWNNKYYQLTEVNNSPAYYLSIGYIISKKDYYPKQYDYTGLTDNQILNNGAPVIFNINNNLYGIVFNDNLTEDKTVTTIAFKNEHNYLHSIIKDMFKSEPVALESAYWCGYNEDDSFGVEIDKNKYIDPVLENSVCLSGNNEIYYNNYTKDETNSLYREEITFNPKNFLYELTPLSMFVFRNYNSGTNLIQTKRLINKNIALERPFALKNEEKLRFTGTYSWVPPTYKDVIVDGEKQTIIEYDGYYQKDYVTEDVPLKVTSYNFYSKDQISAINVTYNFIPNSYILTAEIEHPKIAYDYVVNSMVEKIKYSYIFNGFEYDYPFDYPITFENGTYYGTVNVLDIDNTYNSQKVVLYKKNDIISYNTVKEIIHQNSYVSYEYFSYSQSTPLTNEKIPILYNTELIPATSHQVEYWDAGKNSYAIKTVIDSYSYYSYKYKYETIPLQVASYIYTDDLRISNFDELGAYIDNISGNLGEQIEKQAQSFEDLAYNVDYDFKSLISLHSDISSRQDNTFKTYINTFNNSVKEFDKNNVYSLADLSDNVSTNISQLKTEEKESLNILKETLSIDINNQSSNIKTGLAETKNIIDRKFESFENKFHEDIIGEEAIKNVQGYLITTTYNPIINEESGILSGYSYNIKTENIELEFGGNSIGQILSYTLGTVYSESDIEINEDGSYVVTSKDKYAGIAEILSKLSIENRIPNYNQFMISLVPKLYSSIDFDNPYDIVHDIDGNVVSQKMRNPTDMAKKCIMRADILWTELKKKNIVE